MRKIILAIIISNLAFCSNGKTEFDNKSEVNKATKYNRIWLENIDTVNNTKELIELYVSEKQDTFNYQKRIYHGNELDTSKSTFYNLRAGFINDSTIKGSIKVFSKIDHSIKSDLVRRDMYLYFSSEHNGQRSVVDFKSKKKSSVNFEFKHSTDSLVGLVIVRNEYDTIVDGKEQIRIVEYAMPIDNKNGTDNRFISGFELDKEKFELKNKKERGQ